MCVLCVLHTELIQLTARSSHLGSIEWWLPASWTSIKRSSVVILGDEKNSKTGIYMYIYKYYVIGVLRSSSSFMEFDVGLTARGEPLVTSAVTMPLSYFCSSLTFSRQVPIVDFFPSNVARGVTCCGYCSPHCGEVCSVCTMY